MLTILNFFFKKGSYLQYMWYFAFHGYLKVLNKIKMPTKKQNNHNCEMAIRRL